MVIAVGIMTFAAAGQRVRDAHPTVKVVASLPAADRLFADCEGFGVPQSEGLRLLAMGLSVFVEYDHLRAKKGQGGHVHDDEPPDRRHAALIQAATVLAFGVHHGLIAAAGFEDRDTRVRRKTGPPRWAVQSERRRGERSIIHRTANGSRVT